MRPVRIKDRCATHAHGAAHFRMDHRGAIWLDGVVGAGVVDAGESARGVSSLSDLENADTSQILRMALKFDNFSHEVHGTCMPACAINVRRVFRQSVTAWPARMLPQSCQYPVRFSAAAAAQRPDPCGTEQ